jgi:hypothetical protein
MPNVGKASCLSLLLALSVCASAMPSQRKSHSEARDSVVSAAMARFAKSSAAQASRAQHPLRASQPAQFSLQDRQDSVRRNARFLGWNLSHRLGQQTNRWQRMLPEDATPVRSALSAQSSAFAQAAVTATGIAGFKLRPKLPTGFIPTAVAEGDFNEDGNMDVAISNGGDDTVYVLLGHGDGTLAVPEILYTKGQSPVWITAVKLRAAGHLDLVVANADTSNVEVFSGKGDGTFAASTQFACPQIPTFIIATDLNKDGNQDLVVGLTIDAGMTQPEFEVLLGNGTGSFSGTLLPAAVFADFFVPVPTLWVAAGDLNNDGYIDVVTTSSNLYSSSYLNQAGTRFAPPSAFQPPNEPVLATDLADMNEDGCLDAVEMGDFNFLHIALGSCDGQFTQGPPNAALGDFDVAVKIADVDGDGHLDVIGSSAWMNAGGPGFGVEGGYLVSVLKGDGHGNVGRAQIYRGGISAFSLVVADFTGDHKPEIITADELDNHASLFLNDGFGNFGAPQGSTIGYGSSLINAPNAQSPMKSADLNGDGKPDFFLNEYGQVAGVDPSQLTTVLNDGTGNFLPPIRTPIPIGDTIPIPRFVAGVFRAAAPATSSTSTPITV